MSTQKAIETIGTNLQKQYERWQPRARYKMLLDPTTEETRKLCLNLRKTAKVRVTNPSSVPRVYMRDAVLHRTHRWRGFCFIITLMVFRNQRRTGRYGCSTRSVSVCVPPSHPPSLSVIVPLSPLRTVYIYTCRAIRSTSLSPCMTCKPGSAVQLSMSTTAHKLVNLLSYYMYQ